MVAIGDKKGTDRPLTSREAAFAGYVAAGESQAEAWRRAYKKTAKDHTAAKRACEIAARPKVAARIAALRSRTDASALLSVNERLAILARDAQTEGNTAPMINARARVIDVYTKLAGGAAPVQVEVAGKDGGPIQQSVSAAVTILTLPVRQRIAALRQAREGRS